MEQGRNKRREAYFKYEGKWYRVWELSEKLGVNADVVYWKARRGKIEKIIVYDGVPPTQQPLTLGIV